MLVRLVFFFACFAQIGAFGHSLHTIFLTNDNLGVSLGDQIGVFEDQEKAFENFEEISELPLDSFSSELENIPDFNFTNGRYWFRFSLTNQTSFSQFFFETGRTVTNKVDFYEVDGDNMIRHFISGDDYPYDQKEVLHRKNLFPIELDSGQTKSFYVKLESDGELLFAPVLFHERTAFFQQDFKDQFKNGFYFGLIALVVIIYFFFYVFLRDKTFLFYILYAFSQGMLQFSLEGYSHDHFFPSGGYLTNHVLLFFAGLTVIFLLTYVDNFLHLKEKSKVLRQIFKVSRIVMAVIVIMSLIPGVLYEISFPIINAASLFSVLLAAYCIIYLAIKERQVDVFFALAFIILIIGGVVFILGNLSIVGDKMISLGALKISSALEFVVLSISMSNKYGKLQREKEAAQLLAFKNLQEKNELMDQSNALLEEQVKMRTSEILEQKEEILSSIKYAKRIQEAILPSADHVAKILPNSFVYYRPKDVVSGDFYFVETTHSTHVEKTNRHSLFAAVDCTGHGVPGAFMSIVGNNLLTQSLTESSVNSPAEALNFLNQGVNKTLRRTEEGSVIRDGMDIALCALNYDHTKVVFAGAKNPLYIIRKKHGEKALEINEGMQRIAENESAVLFQVKGDRHAIGNGVNDQILPFNNTVIDLVPEDQLFVFSDGFADQFGGEKGKKYNYKRFRSFLLSISQHPVETQEKLLHEEFNRWLGDEDQIDDVLIMGVKIKQG